jgi:hypothetical protein
MRSRLLRKWQKNRRSRISLDFKIRFFGSGSQKKRKKLVFEDLVEAVSIKKQTKMLT